MKAVGKYIIIIPNDETTTTTSGGLILGEENREDIRYREGSVITVGTDVVGVESGDSVYYDRHAGFGIELNQEQYKVIKELLTVRKPELNAIGERSRKFVQKWHDPNVIALKTKKDYETALGKHQPAYSLSKNK